MLYMIDEGYKMIYIEENGKGVSFCGYRITTMLYRGRSIYIDDLCTLPEARGKGHAKALLDYVLLEAREEGLQSIHLDSGHHRYDAHRLYLNFGFKISSHNFEMNAKSSVAVPNDEVSDTTEAE